MTLHTIARRALTECDIVGIDTDGCLICWAPDIGNYNCGETPAQYGTHLIRPEEWFAIAGSMEA